MNYYIHEQTQNGKANALISILFENRVDILVPPPLVRAQQVFGGGEARFGDPEQRIEEMGFIEADAIENVTAR